MTLGVEDIHRTPKVALHDHLDGGLRPATVLEIAQEIGHVVPKNSLIVADDEHATHAGSLEHYLESFEHTIAVMQRPQDLVRVAHEAVLDLAADNVVYAELRWAPEQHQRAGLALTEAVGAVSAGIRSGCDAAAAAGTPIVVYQILSARRESRRSMEIAELVLAESEQGVVGFDIAGAESGFPAKEHVVAFDLLAAHDIPVTVHAGEAFGLASIKQALNTCQARRIGHGVRIVEDIDVAGSAPQLGPLATELRDREICFELCPTSNLNTGAIGPNATIAEHPFDVLYRSGFNVTVNCDNRLMSRTTLTREMSILAAAFGYSLSDIETFAINAINSAFCGRTERERVGDDVIVPGFAALQA